MDSKNIHSSAAHSEIFQKTNPCVICDYFSCLLTSKGPRWLNELGSWIT